jgi:signal transduction histidine kinase
MASSAMNFHTAHTVAHILKDTAYFIIVISLALSSIQYNRIARQREEMIRIQYEKLKQADKMKDEFINVAAHELRTPIQPIIGMADLLESSVKDNNQKQWLKVIGRNGKRLQKLTDAILDTTKIESGSLLLTKEKLDINDIITNAIDDIIATNYLHQTEKKVHILYTPVHIFLEADKNRLTQVISNLLDNAIKFTKDGTVSISVETNNKYDNNIVDDNDNNSNYVTVSIKDTGPGIDSEIFPKLFSKFASKSFSGTGLGLYISKSIIEAHGGKIWADNNKDGTKGATFAFAIPILYYNKKQMYDHNHNEMKI